MTATKQPLAAWGKLTAMFRVTSRWLCRLFVKFQQMLRRITLFLYVAILFAASCSLQDELSRVAVPGTDLSVVLSQDEKHLWRCELFAGRKSISEQLICAAPDYCEERVTFTTRQEGDSFYIHWTQADHHSTSVRVGIRSRTIEQVRDQ
jgi:hypothetical protein